MSLQVRQVSLTEYPRLKRISGRWYKMAAATYTTFDPSSKDFERMLNSEHVCWSLRKSVQEGYDCPAIKFFIAEGERKIPQSLMMTVFSPDEIYIKYLASCPWNIAPIARVKNFQVKGAGTALMLEIIRHACEHVKSLRLDSYPLTKSFYEKFGFVARGDAAMLNGQLDAIPDVQEPISMSLSIEKICSLYPQYIPTAAA